MLEQQSTAEYTVISLSNAAPTAEERREGQRHMTVLQAGKIVAGERQELCLIRNISARGMMAEVFSDFAADERIGIEFKAGTETRGTVRWVENGRIGIEFERPIDVHHVLAPHGASLTPRSPRLRVDGRAGIEIDDETCSVTVVDISQGGMKVHHDGHLEQGAEVLVSVEGLPLRKAIVRWAEAGSAGLSFTRVMPLDRISYWAARQVAAPAARREPAGSPP